MLNAPSLRSLAIAVLVVGGSAAHADPSPFTANVGVGVALERYRDGLSISTADGLGDPGFAAAPTLYAQAGYRVRHDLAITVHGGITSGFTHQFVFCSDPFPGEATPPVPFHYLAIELGAGVEYSFPDGVWVSPWIGMTKLAVLDDYEGFSVDPTFAFGLEFGVDLYRSERSRVGIFGKMTYDRIRADQYNNDGAEYMQFGAGISYRYW